MNITNQRRLLFYALTIVILFAVSSLSRSHFEKLSSVKPVQERRSMPSLNLDRLDGGSWRLADHRGEVVLVNYWASWCTPCWEEAPMLSRVSQELAPQHLTVIGIAMDERRSGEIPEAVRNFVDTLRIPYTVALSPAMSQMAYGMEGLPTTLLIDQQGRVAEVYIGEVQEKSLRRDLNILFKELSGTEHYTHGLTQTKP